MNDDPSSTKTALLEAVKASMRARDKQRTGALRLLTAAIKQQEIDSRNELTDADVLALLDKLAKQRRDSYQQYTDAGRQDLADQEQYELDLIAEFLPEPLSDGALQELVANAVSDSGAESMRDMGKVMAVLKPQLAGRADMSRVSALVKAQLA